MAAIPRPNGVIRVLEQGQRAFAAFTNAEIDSAFAFSTSGYDGVVFEMNHNPSGCRSFARSHISTVDQTYNAVAACRYPRLKPAQ
jgi:4-hydroxy-2-oxoheptanedioate aldolase